MAFEPAYKVAKAVAPTLADFFKKNFKQVQENSNGKTAPLPETSTIEQIINTAFWTSLQPEEGAFPKISLVFLPPTMAANGMFFDQPLPFLPGVLNKLAPAVERPGFHLGIWFGDDGLKIWGGTYNIPSYCFVVEVVEPGLLVVKYRRSSGIGKYLNVAVLQGDQIKVIDENNILQNTHADFISSLFGLHDYSSRKKVNAFFQLASSMYSHGKGGSLLVVPSEDQAWRQTIIHPIKYGIFPKFTTLGSLMEKIPEKPTLNWVNKVNIAIDGIAGLTAVDGATVITNRYEVMAFGVKIRRAQDKPVVEKITVTEPIAGNVPQEIFAAQYGGTRHLSAAQFVNNHHNAFAMVASQDRKFTIYKWSDTENMVHAHRVDTLLL